MTDTKSHLKYLPAPEIPDWFDAEFAKIVPVCPGDPSQRYLRYVWGMDRMERKGKYERRRYADFDNRYVGKPRWILEGWQSSDVYSRIEWDDHLDVLGSFPINGVWDFIEIHETTEEEYLPLDMTAIERAKSWAFWKSKGFKRSVEELIRQQERRDKMEQVRKREAANKVLDEFVENIIKAGENITNPAFSLPPNVKRTKAGLIIPN